MIDIIQKYRNQLEQEKGQKIQIEKSLNLAIDRKKEKESTLIKYEKARDIIRLVGIKTQEQLSFHISDIASLALNAITTNAYELKLNFIQRRNKTECDLVFVKDGHEMNPISASGGGAVDVASFALRIASWSMQYPKSRNTIILDEPMRYLSAEYQPNASNMIKQLSKKLGLQFIIVTHEPILAEAADKVFKVKQNNGKSSII